jgi:predicted DNA-binding protein (MmcQ/YjbR family)
VQRWARARAEELPGARLEHPFGPEHDVFKLLGKVFMLQSHVDGEPIVTLKARPADGEVLRRAYEEITPGYHMNKRHWITLHPGGRLDRRLVEDLVTESYLLIVEGLPRARRPVDPGVFGQPGS